MQKILKAVSIISAFVGTFAAMVCLFNDSFDGNLFKVMLISTIIMSVSLIAINWNKKKNIVFADVVGGLIIVSSLMLLLRR